MKLNRSHNRSLHSIYTILITATSVFTSLPCIFSLLHEWANSRCEELGLHDTTKNILQQEQEHMTYVKVKPYQILEPWLPQTTTGLQGYDTSTGYLTTSVTAHRTIISHFHKTNFLILPYLQSLLFIHERFNSLSNMKGTPGRNQGTSLSSFS